MRYTLASFFVFSASCVCAIGAIAILQSWGLRGLLSGFIGGQTQATIIILWVCLTHRPTQPESAVA